ncbi:arylsulfatase J isoform X1, partial [Caerostris darwini]
ISLCVRQKKKCLKLCIEKNGITVIVLQGWNDISFRGSLQVPTPNIDALALNGLTLQNYYGEWHCTLSRAALLTGRYPMRYGLQYGILGGEASGLPLNEIILPAYLKSFGSETHMIGKKQQESQNVEEYFVLHFTDVIIIAKHSQTLFQHVTFLAILVRKYGTTPVTNSQGRYATHVFTEAAENIINDHDLSKPLFLYLAHLAVHSGNPYQPVQAPSEDIAQFNYIDDVNRRIHAGIDTKLYQ